MTIENTLPNSEEEATLPVIVDETDYPIDEEQPVVVTDHCVSRNEDDDEFTVIVLDQSSEDVINVTREGGLSWIEQSGPEMEERRRNVLIRELERVQRASFFQFAILCIIPSVLLVIVIANVVGNEASCVSEASFCQLERRTFINAFTSQCICDSIPVQTGN